MPKTEGETLGFRERATARDRKEKAADGAFSPTWQASRTAELSRRFRASQVGSVRPGLTIEDGTLVVTDNYLKVSIPPGVARNQRVRVRVSGSPVSCLE